MTATRPEPPHPFGVYRARFISAAATAGGAGIDLTFQLVESGGQLTRCISPSVTPGDADAAFLTPESYIPVPLEATYARAWAGVPQRWRRVIEG